MGKRADNNRIKFLLTGRQGFTLLETIVAIAILSLAIMGPLELAVRSIGMAGVSRNQIVAFYLAQDAMEYVKNVRDTNFLTPEIPEANWLDKLSDCRGASGCYVDVTIDPDISVKPCIGDCPILKYDNNNYHYDYDIDSENTIFTRTVKISDVMGNTNEVEVKVQVTVSWKEKTGQKDFTIEDNIFNWKK